MTHDPLDIELYALRMSAYVCSLQELRAKARDEKKRLVFPLTFRVHSRLETIDRVAALRGA